MRIFDYFCGMKFRRHIALITAILMLVSNAGFALTVHYCGGTMASISSGFTSGKSCEMPKKVEKACCAKKLQTTHKKCCTEKTVEFKGKTDLIAKFSSEMVTTFLVPKFQEPVLTAVQTGTIQEATSYYCDAHAPPLFKLYHQFLLYA